MVVRGLGEALNCHKWLGLSDRSMTTSLTESKLMGLGFDCRVLHSDFIYSSLHTSMPGIDESRCILVTGATAGIGRALALSLAKLPSKPQVIAAGRRQDRLEELKQAGLETIVLDLDVDASSLTNSMDLILEKYPLVRTNLNRRAPTAAF